MSHDTRLPDDPAPFPPFGVNKREQVYDSPWCGLRRDEVVLPNGDPQEYHVFEISNAVAVVPITREGEFVLVGQYRYTHAYCALDCDLVGELQLEASEQLIVRTFPRTQVEGLLDAGRFADGFTALSIAYALRIVPELA